MSLTLLQAEELWEQRFQDLIGQPGYWLDYATEIEQFAGDWWDCQVLPEITDSCTLIDTSVSKLTSSFYDAADNLSLSDVAVLAPSEQDAAKALWEQRFKDLVGQPTYWLDWQPEIEQFADDWLACQVLPPESDTLNWSETATQVKVSITLDHGADLLTLDDLSSTRQDTNVSAADALPFTDDAMFSEVQLTVFGSDTLWLTESDTDNIACSKVAEDSLGLVEVATSSTVINSIVEDALELFDWSASTQVICSVTSDQLNWLEIINGEDVPGYVPTRVCRVGDEEGSIIFYPRGT